MALGLVEGHQHGWPAWTWLSELSIESFFPADAATGEALRELTARAETVSA